MARPQLGVSPAPLTVNPTAVAANTTEQRALPPACLHFIEGAPQTRKDSGPPAS